MTAVYITVDHFGKAPVVAPLCQGCTPPAVDNRSESAVPLRAEYQVVGAAGRLALCRNCAIHAIKSLAARFMLFDPSATRDLMSFFAAEATKKRPAARKKAASGQSGRRRTTKRVIDVSASAAPTLLLEGKKRSP